MATNLLDELIKQADRLTPDEQLRLIAHLTEKARASYRASNPRRKWAEIGGTADYPLLGEDAQAWVSRTRRESDNRR